MTENKVNFWKIATIILLIVAVILVVNNYYRNDKIDLGGLEISRANLEEFKPILDNYKTSVICDRDNNCISITRVS